MIRGFPVGLICLAITPTGGLLGHADAPVTARGDPPPGGEIAPRPKPTPLPAPLARAPYAGLPLLAPGAQEHDTCGGTVTAVDKGSISVAAEAKKIEQYNAKGEFVKAIIIPAQPPRKFTAVGPLAEGRFLKDGSPWAQYRLSDVKVGDKVFFDWLRFGNVYQVHYVSIRRRPGGRVPPSPGEKPGEKNPWHEKANAFQDLEEKGIPLPEKYQPKLPPKPPFPEGFLIPRVPPAKP